MQLKSKVKKILFILILFCVSCDTQNYYQVKYTIPNPTAIIKKSGQENQDTNTTIINNLNAYGYYAKAKQYTEKEDWNSFVDYYCKDFILPNKIEAIPVRKLIDSILVNADIVMLNESHDLPHHRLLAQSIIDNLIKNNYLTVAIEALNNDTSKFYLTDKLINSNSSIYTKEPFFVNFINSLSLSDNFNIISYEPVINANYKIKEQRDSLMAENILKKWSPHKGKLFIYCGWGHLEARKYSLRTYLQNKLPTAKIISINQTYLNYEHKSIVQDEIRKKIGLMNTPSFIKSNNKFICLQPAYDCEIIHPKYNLDYSDISKYFSNYKRIKLNLKNDAKNYLVYRKGFKHKFNDILPSSIIHQKKDSIYLYLLEGEYELYLYDKNRMFLFKNLSIHL